MAEEEKSIQEVLSLPILLADRLIKSAMEAESSKAECAELAKLADRLSQKLRSAVRLSSSSTIYERPIRLVAADVSKNLDRVLTLVRKCKHTGVLRQVFSITTSADFRKSSSLLDSSVADVTWLLSIFDFSDFSSGAPLSLPPIASTEPILSMIWSSIASVQMSPNLRDRSEAATNLASLARDNDRNKKMIVEENGVVPLLKLLKESSSPDAQITAAAALSNLGNNAERVRSIADVPLITKVLSDSPIRVQISVANLIAKMTEINSDVQEEFGRENVSRSLVTLLCMDLVVDESNSLQLGNKTSLVSLVQINKELVRDHYPSSSSLHYKKERVAELPEEVKHELKISCANALWKLSRNSLLNSRKITETKGLLCLAKLIEKESGELQRNCLMAVMELAAVAEVNTELRRVAFKPNSAAARAVLEQLLRVVNEETSPVLLIPAIKTIGCLARTFPAKETRIIGPLVTQLGRANLDVASEAVVALGKFVSPDNFNSLEHSKAIIGYDGVPKLMNLLRIHGRNQVNELVLLCYLALHVGNSKALEQAKAMNFLEGGARTVLVQHPELRELFAKALHNLTLYQDGALACSYP